MATVSTSSSRTRQQEQNESLFSNAQQLKGMLSQAGIAVGIMLATIGQQWRVAHHYGHLSEQVTPLNPMYTETVQRIQDAFASTMAPAEAARVAVAQVAQMLAQQSAMLANIDHFTVIACLGLLGIAVALSQRIFR